MKGRKHELKEVGIGQLEVQYHPRRDFGEIEKLQGSIKRDGLQEPLLVYEAGEGRFAIIDGCRRFKAVQELGWRFSEITNLTWERVDRKEAIVRLEPGETKNQGGRTLFMDAELQEVINMQWESRKRSGKLSPLVFPGMDGKSAIGDYRGWWNSACKKAGIGRRLFHDFRRTAVRNMIRAGIPERVAMMISGHKTRSVFDRYNIVSDHDLKMAAAKQSAYLDSLRGHNLGTIRPFPEKKEESQNG